MISSTVKITQEEFSIKNPHWTLCFERIHPGWGTSQSPKKQRSSHSETSRILEATRLEDGDRSALVLDLASV